MAADTALLRRWQTSKQAAEVFVQQTPSKSVKENVELPLLRRKLDQTNFLFYPTEDKVSPPLPSISPLDSRWKTTKAKEREFLTRV